MKNIELGMTKDTYYDMCISMNTEPVEKEIPPDFEDLTIQSQEAFLVFNYLPDKWDNFSGRYLGKDMSNLFIIYKLLDINEDYKLLIFELLSIIITEKIKSIHNQVRIKEEKSSGKHNKKTTTFRGG